MQTDLSFFHIFLPKYSWEFRSYNNILKILSPPPATVRHWVLELRCSVVAHASHALCKAVSRAQHSTGQVLRGCIKDICVSAEHGGGLLFIRNDPRTPWFTLQPVLWHPGWIWGELSSSFVLLPSTEQGDSGGSTDEQTALKWVLTIICVLFFSWKNLTALGLLYPSHCLVPRELRVVHVLNCQWYTDVKIRWLDASLQP